MKKKILASILATLSAAVCLTALPANAKTTKNHYTRFSDDLTVFDQSGANSNYCTYDASIALACYYKANVSMDSTTYANANPYCYISTKNASTNAWKYVKEGYGAITKKNIKMTNSWDYDTLYSMIDCETSGLNTRFNITD